MKDKKFYLMFDETPDSKSRKILNILIGELNENFHHKPFLIKTLQLTNVNNSTVEEAILSLLSKVSNEMKIKEDFRLLISDKASYAVLCGKNLKKKYSNLKHITCICHG